MSNRTCPATICAAVTTGEPVAPARPAPTASTVSRPVSMTQGQLTATGPTSPSHPPRRSEAQPLWEPAEQNAELGAGVILVGLSGLSGAGVGGSAAGAAGRGVGGGSSVAGREHVRVPGRAPVEVVPGGDVRRPVPFRAGASESAAGRGRGGAGAAGVARLVGPAGGRGGHVRPAVEGRGRSAGHGGGVPPDHVDGVAA